ncbi:MAG: cation-transporting P-type ATPase [Planctomycetota bacterium]
MPDQPTAPWHALGVDEIVARLASDRERGLSAAEAARRRERYGENRLREQPPEPRWWKLVRQFREVVVWILLVAAVIAAATGDYADTAVIVAIVLVNALIGFFQEERAQTALSALQRMAAPVATVVRDGLPVVVPAREIVPGDLLSLAAGDAVAADARLVGAFALRVQEAALTGESAPVDKAAGVVPAAAPLAERKRDGDLHRQDRHADARRDDRPGDRDGHGPLCRDRQRLRATRGVSRTRRGRRGGGDRT